MFGRLTQEKATLARDIDQGINCWNFAWLQKKCIGSAFSGRKDQRTLNVCCRLHRLIETNLLRKAYCSLCADMASYDTDIASCGTDMVSYGTDMVSCGTDMVSYGSSGKKGLPGLCSVLPPASSVGVLCCTAARMFSVCCLIHCTATRTTFSALLYCSQDCSQCVVSYTVQPLGPPSVNYLRHSADLPLSSV